MRANPKLCFAFVSCFALSGPAAAQIEQGIASAYPGDQGIDAHSSVIFTEGFEQANVQTLSNNWNELQRSNHMTFSSDMPAGSSGRQSLTAPGTDEGPGLYRMLLPGYDKLFVRYYAKFDATCQNVHHFSWVGGHNPATSYPWPRAGQKPSGTTHFSTGVEPHGDWRWDFYTYWQDMGCWGSNTENQCHGNSFLVNAPKPAVRRGEWFSMEIMVKLNSPSSSDGEQAFWINGEKWAHYGPGFPNATRNADKWTPGTGTPFPGFRWRSTDALKINYLWLHNYTDTDPGCRVWFDNVVVATEYIGPMRPTNSVATPRPPANLVVR